MDTKKLKTKNLEHLKKIFLTVNAPKLIRDVRNKLLNVKFKLRDFGIESWLSKGLPPCLIIKQEDCSNKRLTISEAFSLITNLENKHDGETANMISKK